MKMMWTPAKLPPHPSTVPTLSPLAQVVLDELRWEMNNESKPAQTELPTVNNPKGSHEYEFLEEENDEFLSVGGNISFHRNPRSESNTTNMNMQSLFFPTNSNFYNDPMVDESLFSNVMPQNLYRKKFEIQENNYLLSNSNNVGCSPYFHNEIATPTFMTQYSCVTEVAPEFIRKPTLDIVNELSPSMEFEDMELYSFPQGGYITNPKNTLINQETSISKHIPPPQVHLTQKYNSNLVHSKEYTQPRISQNSAISFQNIIQRPNLFGSHKLEPSDQTFVLSGKRSSLKLKNKFGTFKTKNIGKSTKVDAIQTRDKKFIASKNNITYSYNGNTCNTTNINIFNKELKEESEDCVEVIQETQSGYKRDGTENKEEQCCSYEMSDLSFENAIQKYYSEETSQANSQDSPFQKSTESYIAEYLGSENRKYVEKNINSQPELSENCESLFIKTQDYDESNEKCLAENNNVTLGRLNGSSNKLNKPTQVMDNSTSFHNFDIDDLFSSTDSTLSKNVEVCNAKVDSTNIINNKEVIVQEKHIKSDILCQETKICETKYENVNYKLPYLNSYQKQSFHNAFTRHCQPREYKEQYKDNIKAVHSFGMEKTNSFNILPENSTEQESKFDFKELLALRTEQNRQTLHKLKSNFHSNKINNQKPNTLTDPKISTLYSKENFNEMENKTANSQLIMQSDSPTKENNPTSSQFKSTVMELDDGDRYQMCTSKPVVQDNFVCIEENKVQNKEKTNSDNLKSCTKLEPKIGPLYYGKRNEENNDKEMYNSVESYEKLPIQTAEKQKEAIIYFTDPKTQSNKTKADINMHTKNGSSSELYKAAVDDSITVSNSHLHLRTKSTNMKQATIFDCKKFFPPEYRQKIITKTDLQTHSLSNNKNTRQFDDFKKPQLFYNKSNISTKSNNQCNIKTVQIKDKPNKSLKHVTDMPSVNGQNTVFLSSETNLEDKSPLKEIVQTSIIKTQSNKRSWSLDGPKQKKKPRFTAPVMASPSTSKDTALKNHTITVLDDVTANKILQRLSLKAVNKLVLTVTFKEGYTLLNKPENSMKNSRCCPYGIMFMAFWDLNKTDFYWLQLHHVEISQRIQVLIQTLLTTTSRVVCFESQAVFMLLLDVFHSKIISDWYAYDPLIGCWLLDPDNPPKDFLEVISKLEVDRSLLVVNPKADIKTQACDLLPVLDIAMVLLEKRLANASLLTLFSDMEMKLTPILAVMELSSILVDVRKLHEIARVLNKRLQELQKEAHSLAGRSFQLNSHQQLRQILYEELELDVKFNVTVKQTDQGSKSTSEAVLLQFQSFHPLPKVVLEFRHLQKVKSTYVDGLIQFVKHDGTIGTVWEQVKAATGRITSKNPNLQAIPKINVQLQSGESIHLKAIFKAREGFTFLAADFQQIEFRVFAHFTEDNTLLQAFHKGDDIFQELAACWLGGAGPVEREKTKRIVYSVMYGAGAHKLAEYLQVNFSEASSIITSFVDKFPSLRSLPRTVVAQCRAQGYIITLSGRRRLFPNIRSTNYKLRAYSERQAINFLIQGSAADICKAAMLDCDTELKAQGLDAKLLLQIHDELVWEVADSDLKQTAQTVRRAMECQWGERLALKVPLPVCVTSGKTLADMQPLSNHFTSH